MKIFTFFLFWRLCVSNPGYKLHLFSDNEEARCLDGSPYGVYYSPGFSTGMENVLISFWGGGWCAGRDVNSTLLDCLIRSNTSLGSSNTWANQTDGGWGFLGLNASNNPNFYNWHKFDVPYCDGSGHQGLVSEPIEFQGRNLFFRGHSNTLAALHFIESQIKFKTVKNVVVTGCSAGGLATYYWSQYIHDYLKKINPHINVYGIPDSGFFIDHLNINTDDFDFREKVKVLYSLVNQEVIPESPECIRDNQGHEYRCLLAQNLINYIRVPILAIQPSYDTWQLHNILGLTCSDNSTLKTCTNINKLLAHEYRDSQTKLLQNTLKTKDNISAWSISCLIHCFGDDSINSPNWQVPELSGNTINNVIENFLKNKGQHQINLIENTYWPENEKCSDPWSK